MMRRVRTMTWAAAVVLAWCGMARAAGDGVSGAVASLGGASWQTVADGAAELDSGETAPRPMVRIASPITRISRRITWRRCDKKRLPAL